MTVEELNAKYGKPITAQNDNPLGFTKTVKKPSSGIGVINTGITPNQILNIGNELPNSPDLSTSFTERKRKLDALNKSDVGLGTKALGNIGAIAGGAVDIANKGIEKIPVIGGVAKEIGNAFSQVVNWLGNKIGDTKVAQKLVENISDEDFNKIASNLQSTGDIGNLAMLGIAAEKSPTTVADVAKTATDITKKVATTAKDTISKITPDPSNIMNRVARLTPTDATNFEKLSGMTHGDYLAKSGNFGSPDTIITNEAIKFVNSIKTADAEIAKLPGIYESAPLKTMADELLAREVRVSSPGAPSPDLSRATELKNKLDSGGLTMPEINELKRIYERNVRLDFARQNLPEQTARANNIDSAVRQWQLKTAQDLGLKNLDAINKQTQISKFIVDKLGKQIIGKTGNDLIGLTDWIILAGGEPSSVSAFLTKKFFSSPAVRAKIASWLAPEPSIKPVVPNKTITPENINRQVNPLGFKAIEAPKEGSPKVQINTPINQPSRKAINQGTEIVPKTSTPQSQLPKEKLNATSSNSITSLIQEAKKYKSAEEFVKAQPNLYHGTSAKFDAFNDSMRGSITGAQSGKGAIWFTDDPATAKAYSIYASEDGLINKLMAEADRLEKIAQKSGLESDWKKYDAITQEMEKQSTYDATFARRANANVKEATVKGDFLTVDAKGKTPQELSTDGNIDSWLNIQLEKARKAGKDGVIFKNLDDAVGLYDKPSTHYAIFDSKNIITKSQLTDIWNKANKK